MFCNEVDDVVGNCELEPIELRLLLENCNAVLEVRHANVGYHSPLEATD